jgi:nucleotide-binding universal stress UspA family protein
VSGPAHEMSSAERVDVFDRILVEIDETPESLAAAAQAKCLCAPGCQLELLAVAERAAAAHAGAAATFAADSLTEATAAALEHARSLLEPTSARLVVGNARQTLLAEARATGATLVVVGTHRHSRFTARLFGTVDAAVLRDAPCSVLLARPGWGASKPKEILVGLDGSAASELAERVARSLASRLDVDLQPVIALGGKPLDEAVFDPAHADALLDPRDPVAALDAVAGECDLLVIGHRGAHGRHALGSVGERIAFAAHSSVLVVRPTAAAA